VERVARLTSKLSIKIFEGAVEGAIDGALKSLGKDKLRYMIKNNYYIIESIFYGLAKPPIEEYLKIARKLIQEGKVKPEYFKPPDNLSDEEKSKYMIKQLLKLKEIKKLENFRKRLGKTILPVFGMARNIASRFPKEYIDQYLTGEWLYKQAVKRHPEIAKIIDESENGREWLENQAREIREYITGRLVWDPKRLKLVSVEEYEGRRSK